MAENLTRRAALMATTGVAAGAALATGAEALGAPAPALEAAQAAQAADPTSTVVLAFLTAGHSDMHLPQGVEVPIMANNVYAPGHPLFNAAASVRPFFGSSYVNWEVALFAAPITVHNQSATSGTLLVNIYSDNAYVYQQMMTVPAGAYMPVYFGAQALGYISALPGSAPMPIAVTMRASGADMTAVMDTKGSANYRPGVSYPRIAGFGVHLLPMD